MKKSVVILIAIIYVASIALVSFFGLQFKTFNEIIYTKSVELLNEDIKLAEDGTPYVIVRLGTDGTARYQIRYRVHPDNATDANVNFIYDKQNTSVSVDENGVVTFTKKGAVDITLQTTDGSGAKATIRIYAR